MRQVGSGAYKRAEAKQAIQSLNECHCYVFMQIGRMITKNGLLVAGFATPAFAAEFFSGAEQHDA